VLDVFCMDLLMVCHDLVNKEIKSLFLWLKWTWFRNSK
jgi:hypothetical protein